MDLLAILDTLRRLKPQPAPLPAVRLGHVAARCRLAKRVKVGRGPGTLTQALNVAAQLAATGRWNAEGPITVNAPADLFNRLQGTTLERYDATYAVNVYAGVYDLRDGVDFERRVFNPGPFPIGQKGF